MAFSVAMNFLMESPHIPGVLIGKRRGRLCALDEVTPAIRGIEPEHEILDQID
ncbi:hypothetical protein GCM10010096_04960 [Alcaligenes pakistanensis]|uniref:Uncharacterized protein n=1 Tax=Alcaligenes pakistanensis TaxID=1482717 RepID=A0A8H9M3Z8_9BURK|nr:hypothetical protein GCM10010096_04960 [Alcaligenes pakistanensis]